MSRFEYLFDAFGINGAQMQDIELFLRDKANLLDSKQLAEAQLSENGPEVIHVIAPHPLELYNKNVYNSTKEWIRKNFANENARMVFWRVKGEGYEPYIARLARDLFHDLDKNERVFEILASVSAIAPFFLSEYTVWNPKGPHTRAFLSRKEGGTTVTLYELSSIHATWIANCVEALIVNSEEKMLSFPVVSIFPRAYERIAGIVSSTEQIRSIQEIEVSLSDDWKTAVEAQERGMFAPWIRESDVESAKRKPA